MDDYKVLPDIFNFAPGPGIEASTTTEALNASLELSMEDAPIGALIRMGQMHSAGETDSPLIQPGELNEQFGQEGVSFNRPMKAEQAQIVVDRANKRMELERTIANGPQGPVHTIANFAAAMVPHALDPINVASGFGVAAALRAATAGTALGARAFGIASKGSTAKPLGRSASQVLAFDVGEALLGNLAVEPLALMASEQDLKDYTASDALFNVFAGSLAFPAIKYGFSKAGSALTNHSVEADTSSKTVVVSQMETNRAPDNGPIVDQIVGELNTPMDGRIAVAGKRAFENRPLEASVIKTDDLDVPIFASFRGNTLESRGRVDNYSDIHDGKIPGVPHFTNDGMEGTAISGSRLKNNAEQLHELKLKPGQQLINLDFEPEADLRASIESISKGNVKFRKGENLNGYMERLKAWASKTDDMKGDVSKKADAAMYQLGEVLQSKGFAGYVYKNDSYAGRPTRQTMGIGLFPDRMDADGRLGIDVDSKAEFIATHRPQREMLNAPTREDAQNVAAQQLSRKGKLTFDADDELVYLKTQEEFEQDFTEVRLRADIEQYRKTINDETIIDPDVKLRVADADSKLAKAETEEDLLDLFTDCVVTGQL